MLEEVCAEIRNWFTYRSDIYIGDYEIADGVISPSVDFKDAEYIRIMGSRKNNGVHKLSDDDLVDEGKWHGSIWLMSPPKMFLMTVKDIEAWQEKYGSVESANMSPYQSESFGGYSYSKTTGGQTDGSSSIPTWQSVFANRLKQWRRIREI